MATMAERSERLDFVGVTQAHRAALQAFVPTPRAALPQPLEDVYTRIRGHAAFARLFADAAMMARAADAQTWHWLALFSARCDQASLDAARKVGQIHNRVGLAETRARGSRWWSAR